MAFKDNRKRSKVNNVEGSKLFRHYSGINEVNLMKASQYVTTDQAGI
jgi:hypothetical protein